MADLPIHDRRVLQPQPNAAANVPAPYEHQFNPYAHPFYNQYPNYGLQHYAPPPGLPTLAHPQPHVAQHYLPPSNGLQHHRYADENVRPALPATPVTKQRPNLEPRPAVRELARYHMISGRPCILEHVLV
jgi:hypothetical protein